MRVKRFSGYSEASPRGVSYISGQVVSKYVLDPLDSGIEKIDEISSSFSNSKRAKEKRARLKGIVKPLKKLLRGGNENNKPN